MLSVFSLSLGASKSIAYDDKLIGSYSECTSQTRSQDLLIGFYNYLSDPHTPTHTHTHIVNTIPTLMVCSLIAGRVSENPMDT